MRPPLARTKLGLLCLGARLVEDDGGAGLRRARPVLRTRAGLGSGLELRLGRDTFVNVPVVEPFAARSPYEVRVAAHGAVEVSLDGRRVAHGRVAPRPAWYDEPAPSGRPMRRVATMQGTVLAVYAGRVCDFWVRGDARPARENCRFCAVGLNLGADDDVEKTEADVLATVKAARRDPRLAYVDFNAGHADDFGQVDRLLPLLARLKRETGLLVGVQVPPHPDRARWAALRAAGVNRVSFCVELFEPKRFASVCPGKARVYGQAAYFEAVATCVSLAREGPRLEPWVVNGELVAGLEPPSATIAGIDALVRLGAVPTVCAFRPLIGTDLADAAPPSPDELAPVFAALYERCVAAGLPIGVASAVRPSLVLLAEEARALVAPDVLRRLRPARRRLAARVLLGRLALLARRESLRTVPRPLRRDSPARAAGPRVLRK